MSEQTREVSESFQTLTNQVTTYLQPRVQAIGDITITGLQRIAVGWSHETWLFDATWVDASGPQTRGLCLRRDPGNALLRNMSDLGEQFRVLQCLEQTAVPAPKAYWFEPDHSVLGASALIMERVAGECPSPWGREGRQFYAAAAARSVLPMDFTDTLAAIHTVDWQAAGLSFLGVPETGTGFARREIAKWRNLAEQSGLPIEPVLVDLMCWLEANAPSCERLVLVEVAHPHDHAVLPHAAIDQVFDQRAHRSVERRELAL